ASACPGRARPAALHPPPTRHTARHPSRCPPPVSPMPPLSYDLIVIGSGPAGEKGAAQAAYFGKRVALIEREPVLGGAAANTGTLPSKTLRETALSLSGLRQRGLDGVEFGLKHEATIGDLLFRATHVTELERQRILDNLQRHRVELKHGFASFVDKHTVLLKREGGTTEKITSDVFLIATGSSPMRPPMYQFEATRIFDSDEIVKVDEIPKAMAVIGGGVIGCEYASIFAALGTKVTLIDSKPTLLPFLDGELSSRLRDRLSDLGIEIMLDCQVEATVPSDADVTTKLKNGKQLKTDIALICAGRVANV